MRLRLNINAPRTTVTAELIADAGDVLMTRQIDVTTRDGRDDLDVLTDALTTEGVPIDSSEAMTAWAECERPND